jgi:hypothetical protein
MSHQWEVLVGLEGNRGRAVGGERRKLLQKEQQRKSGQMGALKRAACAHLVALLRTPSQVSL